MWDRSPLPPGASCDPTYHREVSQAAPSSDHPTTLGALRASGHVHRSVKEEIRANLFARLGAGEDPLPGIFGFDQTVRAERLTDKVP